MQTRRDQLHAYRFLTKRALAALVTGEPNAVEPPMRRLTVTTISGVMIAVLVGVGFAVFGLIKPSAGDSWKDESAIIIERETGARYVYRNGELDPVLNYTSGVLAVSGDNGTTQAKVVQVDRDEIASTKRGPTIGIDGIPDSLPAAGDIQNSPFVVCSRQKQKTATTLQAVVGVSVGSDVLRTSTLPSDAAVLVNAPSKLDQSYLLWQGRRFALGSDAVLQVLRLTTSTPLTVGTAFLQSVDQGTPLATPEISGRGDKGLDVGGQPTKVGELLRSSDNDEYSVMLADGVQTVNPLEAALLQTVEGSQVLDVTTADIAAVTPSAKDGAQLLATAFRNLPDHLPTLTAKPGELGDVCAQFGSDPSQPPTFATVSTQKPNFPITDVTESSVSAGGKADSVTVSPGHAALVKSDDSSPTIFAIAEPGLRYAFAEPGLLTAFGYGGVKPAQLSDQLLNLINTGPAFERSAALTPVAGSS